MKNSSNTHGSAKIEMVGIQFQFIGRIIHSIYGEKPIFSTKDRQNSTLEPRAAKIDGRNKIFLLLLIFAAVVAYPGERDPYPVSDLQIFC